MAAHRFLIGYAALFGLAFAVCASRLVLPSSQPVYASAAHNVMGWAWADPIGWISLNDQNPDAGNGVPYGVNLDPVTGEIAGFGWSPNAGWVCFGSACNVATCAGTPPPAVAPYQVAFAKLDSPPMSAGPIIRHVHGWAKVCNQGDAGWISLNCADPIPSACATYPYHVPLDMSTQEFRDQTPPGSPANGTSFAWNASINESGFGYVDFREAYLAFPPEDTEAMCVDGVDNDLDGAVDCLDTECATWCAPEPPSSGEPACDLGSADACCSDQTDNDSNGSIDCADSACQAESSMCTVAWLQTRFGNVYAQQGIAAIAAPAEQYNASYCLSITDGSIVGFASENGCQAISTKLDLPSGSTGYRGTLGAIDIAGIEQGRYGAVIDIADGQGLLEFLNGRVYRYVGSGPLKLPAKKFENGSGATGRGSGLLFVRGADVEIQQNMSYVSTAVGGYLRNLASFGMIVLKDEFGNGGNIRIQPNVDRIVGAYFAEGAIQTGNSKTPLQVYGLLAARQLEFERTGGASSTASEIVTFDGRAVANPPPGMQDVGKSLPTTKDAY